MHIQAKGLWSYRFSPAAQADTSHAMVHAAHLLLRISNQLGQPLHTQISEAGHISADPDPGEADNVSHEGESPIHPVACLRRV
jgi:hypothetical protein